MATIQELTDSILTQISTLRRRTQPDESEYEDDGITRTPVGQALREADDALDNLLTAIEEGSF